MENNEEKRGLIENIIQLEWNLFDKVPNEGGRACCQDDWETFSLMRESQYQSWTVPLLESWRSDIFHAADEGRNPMTEKYGYMMIYSDPEENAAIAEKLPPISEEKLSLCRHITERLLLQAEDFRREYHRIAGRARPLRISDEKEAGWTSIESYQLGELSACSMRTLKLLDALTSEYEAAAINYSASIIENSLRKKGFKNAAEAEAFLAAREKNCC